VQAFRQMPRATGTAKMTVRSVYMKLDQLALDAIICHVSSHGFDCFMTIFSILVYTSSHFVLASVYLLVSFMEDQQDSANLDFHQTWRNARCLNICEVENELRNPFIQTEASGSTKPHLQMAYTHAKRFSKLRDPQVLQQLHSSLEDWEAPNGTTAPQQDDGDMPHTRLAAFELAQLVNLVPNDVDEAVSLIPSLERFSPVDLTVVLDIITGYIRQSSATGGPFSS